MKLKSLILGTVAAAGLSTGAFAADLGVLTSLDVCDALGISGLTISSDTNCLQISGGVSYEFNWGDYRQGNTIGSDLIVAVTPVGSYGIIGSSGDVVGADGFETDYDSKVEAWLKFVGTADSDFGPAKAVLKIKSVSQTRYINEGEVGADGVQLGGAALTATSIGEVDNRDFYIDEGYVSIGDSTVIMAGKKSSIANFGDSEPFNFTKLFAWDAVDDGVGFDADGDRVNFTGEHVIQVVSDLGNGLNVGVGLENLNGADADGLLTNAHGAGTLVGVLSYAGEGITAHVTGLAIGVLDGQVDAWGVHAGATGTFDNFRVRAAVGYLGKDYTSFGGDESNTLHAMLTGEATFDMFTVALSGEYARAENTTAGTESNGFGIGGSIGAAITDGVKINLGARYFNNDLTVGDENTLQVAAQLVAAVSETIKVTGEVGAYWRDTTAVTVFDFNDAVVYGSAELAWAPGGGFTSSIKGQATSEGAYRATYKAAKTFE
ncbi:MAG: hypothetical protein JWP26_2349 [Devosia sp.]|uniref:hypothetical protein n=1 Tax=Devosia sp. TaxID=1871048 RepID=UPI00260E8C73|nr:hypothetical protein [Devosia sp.]MDB5587379.1 hypothetical protein [Devosia sp.]